MSDIGERSGPARALIGTDQQGHLVVLATDSAWVAWDCEHVCTGAEDIGLASTRDCYPERGLYLWEGYSQIGYVGAWDCQEPDTVYHGTVRRVRPEEVAELYAMTPPETEGVSRD
jgi:hypothetical protein